MQLKLNIPSCLVLSHVSSHFSLSSGKWNYIFLLRHFFHNNINLKYRPAHLAQLVQLIRNFLHRTFSGNLYRDQKRIKIFSHLSIASNCEKEKKSWVINHRMSYALYVCTEIHVQSHVKLSASSGEIDRYETSFLYIMGSWMQQLDLLVLKILF